MIKRLILVLTTIGFSISYLFAQQSEWQWQNPEVQGSQLNSVCFTGNALFAVGEYGTMIKSDNMGSAWTIQNSGSSEFLASVFFTDSLTGYAVGTGGILKTNNGGNSWF